MMAHGHSEEPKNLHGMKCCVVGCGKLAVGRCGICQKPLCEAAMDDWKARTATCEQAHGPHVALVLRSPWAHLVLSGLKTWELRGGKTLKRGRIGIALAGTGTLLGEVTLAGAKLLVDWQQDLRQNVDKHRVIDLKTLSGYKKIWAWELANPKLYDQPVEYKHPKGAVTWVKLSKASDFQEAKKKEENESKRRKKR